MKPGRPVLYELLKEQPHYRGGFEQPNGHAHHEPPTRETDYPPPPETASGGFLSAGRAIRLPVGYLFVAVAVLIVLGSAAYMLGFMNGRDDDASGDLDQFIAQQETMRLQQELREPVDAGDRPIRTDSVGSGSTPGAPTAGSDAAPRRSGSNQAGPMMSDPRVGGYNYYRLIQTSRTGAVKVAEFCRKFNLEAYVVSANNRDTYVVYVLPGFKSSETPEVEALVRKIENVRVHWMAEQGGDAFDGYYKELKK